MNLDQARALAEEYFNGVRAESLELGLHSFNEGYVAWSKEADATGLPEVVGGACIVIDKVTGEVAIRPLLNPETVAEQWPGRTTR